MSAPEMPHLYTPQEVAGMLRSDPRTIHRWLKAGKIPREHTVVTPGGRRLVKAGYIDALLRGEL